MNKSNKGNISFSEDLLDKYYQKKCSGEEKEIVEQWFADLRFNKETTRDSHKQWELTSPEGAPKDLLDEILYKVHYQLHIEEGIKINKRSWVTRLKKFLPYAAAGIILFLLVSNLWLLTGTQSEEKVIYTEIYAPLGSRVKFDLPDGSSGWLNSGSSLKFPIKFRGRERKVILSGEGYFNVAHNPKKSFVVNTNMYQVRALGTSFNVQAYSDNNQTEEITLEKGKVQIEKINSEGKYRKIFSMEPGQHVQIDLKNHAAKTTTMDSDKYTSWKDGKLIFRNDPLKRLITCMERFYNVDIEITDKKLFEYHFHATFEEETLFETLRLLKLSTPIDYQICKREKNSDETYTKREIKLFLRN